MGDAAVWISAIRLKREGEKVLVSIEVDGRWFVIISEPHDSAFSHTVEAPEMLAAAKRHE